jgi:CBS domain-containing protein
MWIEGRRLGESGAEQEVAAMLVRDVMSTGAVTARATDTLRSVAIKMLCRHCGAIPVVDEGNRLVGIVAVRDIMLPLYPNYGDYIHDSVRSRDFVEMEAGYTEVLAKTVGEVMTRNPLTVSPNDPILQAASYMGLKNFRRIPVVEQGRLVGMLSIGDINRGLFFSQHGALRTAV